MRTAAFAFVAVPLALLSVGCASSTLVGRVIRAESSYIQWTGSSASSPAPGAEAVGGAAITVTRDPRSPGRTRVGSGVSQADGTFVVKLDALGAGWTDEQWLIVVERKGAGRAEYIGRLEEGELLVMLAPGTELGPSTRDLWNGDVGSMPTGASIMEEAKRYR